MTAFDRSVFWPAYKAAGFLRPALVKQSGKPAATVDIKYVQPDEQRLDGAVASRDHAIKYQHADLPFLAEGDAVSMLDANGVVIKTERFRVRQVPMISNDPGDDRSGYFRWAVLTRI